MKRVFAVIFCLSLTFSIVIMSAETVSGAGLGSRVKKQVGYVKRKSRKVYHRSKRGTR